MKKIPVGILGATGMVGQKFVELLSHHPWFEIILLSASPKSQNKTYQQATRWLLPTPPKRKIARIIVSDYSDTSNCVLLFSGLHNSVAGEIETNRASQGYIVISNSSHHRMDPDIPLVIPEVNPSHLHLITQQTFSKKGCLITNPNCSVIGLTMALKPLLFLSEIEKVQITTLQALSGAGYPGVSGLDIIDNVIPNIPGEESKLETEPLKILGSYHEGVLRPYPIEISAHCTRVPVLDGHLACVSVKFKDKVTQKQLLNHWKNFSGDPQKLKLPSAPRHPIIYFNHDDYPQPRLHRHLGRGMSISIGRLRPCNVLDWKFVILLHNTIRGAVGSAVLNAELLIKQKLIEN
ncbi:MAG: aspartate-semialdehyde dehydrogenase [Victivallaceae bacterium]